MHCQPCDADGPLQEQLLSSLKQLPSAAKRLAPHALIQQLQMAKRPASIQLSFKLLGSALGLPFSKLPSGKAPGPQNFSLSAQTDLGVQHESTVKQLLQQPTVMSHWLSQNPLAPDVAAAWNKGLTELLHSVLSMSERAEARIASSLQAACKPFITRYVFCEHSCYDAQSRS